MNINKKKELLSFLSNFKQIVVDIVNSLLFDKIGT